MDETGDKLATKLERARRLAEQSQQVIDQLLRVLRDDEAEPEFPAEALEKVRAHICLRWRNPGFFRDNRGNPGRQPQPFRLSFRASGWNLCRGKANENANAVR